ncbi:MAG: hypothetical protein ABSG70_20460 [Terriglobales bacterium]|jgi:probable HAF family extracellular repeat protein
MTIASLTNASLAEAYRTCGKSSSRVITIATLLFLAWVILLPNYMYAGTVPTSYKVTQVIPPGTTSPYAAAVNKSNVVVGSDVASNGNTQGFEMKGSKFTALNFPGASGFTRASGINDAGVIAGDFYLSSDTAYHGYTYNKGKYTQYDVALGSLSTSVFAINNSGNLGGSAGKNGQANQGFVDIGGTVSTFYADGSSQSTFVYGMNDSNESVGDYYDSNNYPHCFYRDASGNITLLNAPNTYLTACSGINNDGVIVGWWVDTNGQLHAFLYNGGTYTELPFYYASGVSNSGSVVGYYLGPGSSSGVIVNYLAEPKAFGSYANIEMTGAQSTAIYGINDSKAMVGVYTNSSGATHGLLFAKKKITNIDDPDAQTGTTTAFGINTAGDLVGAYTNGSGTVVGFSYSNGTYTDVAPAGSQYTNATGINDSGVITGQWFDASGNGHGYTYSGSTFTSIDVPGATFTGCWGINNSGDLACQWGDQYGDIESALYNGSSFTTLNVPGAYLTAAHSINKSGDIVFLWQDTYGNDHGAILNAGSYYVFDVPASYGASTDADGINTSGEIVGHFTPTGSSNFEGWEGKL